MYLVNAENLTTAAGGTIQSVAGETNNVGIYAINGKLMFLLQELQQK